MHTAICVQYLAGATAAHVGSDKETQRSNFIIQGHEHRYWRSISFTDIEGALFDTMKIRYQETSIARFWVNLTFNINVSSMSYCFDIETADFNIEVSQDLGIWYWRSKHRYQIGISYQISKVISELRRRNLRHRDISKVRSWARFQIESKIPSPPPPP